MPNEMPTLMKEIAVEFQFNLREWDKIKKGFRPKGMDDRWAIEYENQELRFRRTWTGFCDFILRFRKKSGGVISTCAILNRDPEQYLGKDDEYDLQVIRFLIDTLLLGKKGTLPKQGGLESESKKAISAWQDGLLTDAEDTSSDSE